MHMHSLYLLTLITLLFSLSLSQTTTFYIGETSNSSHPDGSRSNPFPNLYNATMQLFPGTFDIILLGESITINDEMTFPPRSICIIRPETVPESGHFPFYISIYGSMEILETNVTFQDIQFIKIFPAIISADIAIILSRGFLLLNRVLLSDIQYPSNGYYGDPYPFLSAEGESWAFTASLLLIDCQFKNLSNVAIEASLPQVVIQNTTFENIHMDVGAFLNFGLDELPDSVIRMVNTSLVNSWFGFPQRVNTGRFLSFSIYYAEFSLEGFSAKNISITNRATLIEVTNNSYEDSQAKPGRVNIKDFVLEDIMEIEYPDEIEEDVTTKGVGLIFDLSALRELTVTNLTARNVNFESGSLLRYLPHVNSFLPLESSESKFSLQDIKLENCSNASFLISFSESGQVEDVELVNVMSNTLPVFSFLGIETVSVKNIYGRNISGPVISLEQVFSQNLQNLTFENVSMSQKNSLILLTRYFDMVYLDLIANIDQSTVVTDLFIDGCEYIGAEDKEQKPYVMTIEAETGTVLITDSIWRNINTESLFVSNMDAFKMDNFTVNGAPAQATSAE